MSWNREGGNHRFRRTEALTTLQATYKHFRLNPAQNAGIILVRGDKGTGKSRLVNQFADDLLSDHHSDWHVIHKVNNVFNQNIPYYALKSFVATFTNDFLSNASSKELAELRKELRERLGAGFFLLVSYVPELGVLMDKHGEESLGMPSHVSTENQLPDLFLLYIEAILSVREQPVLLIEDDFHYIDISSLYLFKHIIHHLGVGKFLIAAVCDRDREISYSALSQFLEELRRQDGVYEEIELHPLIQEEVKTFAEQWFGEGVVSEPLVELFYTLTQGYIHQLDNLLPQLLKSNIVWLENGLWHADRHAAKAYLKKHINKPSLLKLFETLSEDTKRLLLLMSCMGRFSLKVLSEYLQTSKEDVRSMLKISVSKGILSQDSDKFHFTEANYGDIFYRSMPEAQRNELHYFVGHAYLKRGIEQLTFTQFIFALEQLNKSAMLSMKKGETELLASLNLRAGDIARSNDAFMMAMDFYEQGLSLLTWSKEQNQELSYKLELAKALCEYYLGNHDLAEVDLDNLLSKVTEQAQRMTIYKQKITINIHLGRLSQARGILGLALAELGVRLPVSVEEVSTQVAEEKATFRNFLSKNEPIDVLLLPPVRPLTEQETYLLELLHTGGIALHYTSTRLMMLQCLKIINVSQASTPNRITALAYATYGRMLIASLEDIELGYQLGKIAVGLNDKLEDFSLRGRVYGVYAFYIHGWKHHLRESIPMLEKGWEASIKSGDMYGAYILSTHILNVQLIYGHQLEHLQAFGADSDASANGFTSYIPEYQKVLVNLLRGEMSTFYLPEKMNNPLSVRYNLHEELFYRHYVTGRYAYHFGFYDWAVTELEEAHHYSTIQEGSLLYPEVIFYLSLSILSNLVNYDEEKRQSCLAQLDQYVALFKVWEEHAQENFSHKYWLIQAELMAFRGDEKAGEAFEKAIAFAVKFDFAHVQAMAHEHYLRWLLKRGAAKEVLQYHYTLSAECFRAWGAVALERQLHRQFGFLDKQGVMPLRSENLMEEAQYLLGNSLNLRMLIRRMLKMFLETSGAYRCVLLQQDDESLKVIGEGRFPDNYLKYFEEGLPLEEVSLERAAVMYAFRRKETLNTDLNKEIMQVSKGLLSVFCSPFQMPDGSMVLLYLENKYVNNLFDDRKSANLGMVGKIGVLNLHNAIVHEEAIRLNEALRKEVAEKERLNKAIEFQKNEHIEQIILTQENERKRIAEDLHDSVGGMLSSVRMQFKNFSNRIEGKGAEKYAGAIDLLDRTCEEVRRLSHNMMPGALTKFGLVPALQDMAEQVMEATQIKINVYTWGMDDERLDSKKEVALYRICQELLQNMVKHAKATKADIQLMRHENALNLMFEDNGVGFDMSTKKKGIGLENIASRVNSMKGTLNVDSFPERGTTFIIDIPLV
ncbi:AAA family ATPase [Limibacter armeniacum]|uniref:AAA family ATPase n=1 Tax=Limibacter armeniacum TaxID=466084 RepID=UPI002FE5C649